MAIADPKKYAVPKDDEREDDGESLRVQIEALQAQVQALLTVQAQPSGGGLTEDVLERVLSRVATLTAEAQERAANPSNKTHPGISVYSYPEGDRARPRPDLKCPMFWVGYPLSKDTTTAEEIELLNQAQPGEYEFRRIDGSLDKLTVDGERDAGGKVTRLLFTFLTKERRDSLPSMVDMLRFAFRIKSPQELELEALRAEVERLRQPVAQ